MQAGQSEEVKFDVSIDDIFKCPCHLESQTHWFQYSDPAEGEQLPRHFSLFDMLNLNILEIDIECRSSLVYTAEPAPMKRNPSRDLGGSWNRPYILIALKMELVLFSQKGC